MGTETKRHIGIINGGGDCAGMNAVISAIVKTGIPLGYKITGFEKSWEGLLAPAKYQELDLHDVKNISYIGGTILRTTNHGKFGAKVGAGQKALVQEEVLQEAKNTLRELGIEGLIVIGGDGTLSAGLQLEALGVNMVGVPKTIDNDLMSTEKTFGFSTAVGIVLDAIDKLQTTARSHDRVIFVECMGRHAGWISLFAGLAGNADAILLPEFPVDVDDFVGYLRHRYQQHRYATIVIVSEGIKLDNELTVKQSAQSGAEMALGGVSAQLMRIIDQKAPQEFEMRNVILGHVQRGGSPNAEDRILAQEYGVAAMEAYHRGEFGKMVCLQGGTLQTVSIEQAVGQLKVITPQVKEYQTALKLGIYINGNQG